jgi:LPS-assembly protein
VRRSRSGWKAVSILGVLVQLSSVATAQNSSNSTQQQLRQLFNDDLSQIKTQRAGERKRALTADKSKDDAVGVSAPKVEYSKDNSTVVAKGGVIVSRAGIQVEAEQAQVNLTAREAEVLGGVLVSNSQGSTAADSAIIDLDSQSGVFNNIRFVYDQSAFLVKARQAVKYTPTKYRLLDTDFTTCDCKSGFCPWSIHTNRAEITQGGYAHTFGTSFWVGPVPVLYAPYFGFPAKTERAAGLLAPQAGISKRDGFRFAQPIFLPLDGSTDLSFTPFVQTLTRFGTFGRYRQNVSLRNTIHSEFLYSDEAWRGDNLKGLQVPTGFMPSIDTNRFALMYGQIWRTLPTATVPSTFSADIHYVSDDEILRELPNNNIGISNSIFLTSSALWQSYLGSYTTASLSSEYNQVLDYDTKASDDAVFQRLPEASVSSARTFYPFGSNPIGLKMNVGATATVTDFARGAGYEGLRTHLVPTVSFPFHFYNYVASNLQFSGYETLYRMKNTGGAVKSSDERRTGAIQYSTGTAVERAFSVDANGWFSRLVGMGATNDNQLVRLKHTIEPVFQYTFIPDVSQDQNPLFDQYDRIRQRSLFSYGFDSSLFGKFRQRYTSAGIAELTPRPQDLPELGYADSTPELANGFGFNGISTNPGARAGKIAELVSFSFRQTYDYAQAKKKIDPTRRSFSDYWVNLSMSPSNYLTVGVDGNVSPYKWTLTTLSPAVSVKDDRGDILSFRYSLVNPVNLTQVGATLPPPEKIEQIQGNAEIVLSDRFRWAYFTQYDLVRSNIIQEALALRYMSACNCWHVDVGMSKTTNPDNNRFNVRFGLNGLGDLAQDWMYKTQLPVVQTAGQ